MRTKRLVEDILLWRAHAIVDGSSRQVEATAEQVGETSFELRVVAGGQLLMSEVFEDPASMLDRAEELRKALASHAG